MRLCAVLLLIGACTTLGPQSSVQVRDGVPPRARVDPWKVVIHTSDTGPPKQAYSVRGSIAVRVHEDVAFGFGHLRVLRREAGELGCDAIIVDGPALETDDVICGQEHMTPLPCIKRWDATCIAFSSPTAGR